jgi:hypothetical protein
MIQTGRRGCSTRALKNAAQSRHLFGTMKVHQFRRNGALAAV